MTQDRDVEDLLDKRMWREERRRLRNLRRACGLAETVTWGKLCYTLGGSNVAITCGMKHYCALGSFKGRFWRTPMAC